MTKSQAGTAVVAIMLLAGVGGLCYHYLWPRQGVISAAQIPPGSPRSVVYDLLQGIRDGEGELIRRSLYAQDAHETEAIGALVEHSVAASRLAALGDATFGPGQLRPPGLPLSRADLAGQVLRLNEIVDDDLADVDFNPNASPSIFHLKMVDGRWRVMVRRTFDPARSEDTGRLIEVVEGLRLQTKVYAQIGRDIESGRLTTPEQAQSSMNRQISDAFRGSWYGSIWARNPATMPLPTPALDLP